MRSFQGVVCSDLQHLHTHLQLQHDNRLLSPLLLHLFNHRLAPNTVTTDLFSCRFPRLLHRPSLSGGPAHSPFVFCCLFLPPCFVLSCVFGPSFSFSPSGGASPATVISHLFPVGRGQVGEKNTGTNQGCESGDEGHRLGFICVTSLSFTRSYNPPSIPSPTWCRITPWKTISSSLLPLPSSPTMITGFTAEKGRNTQTSVTSFSSPVRAGVLLWDA